MKKFSIWTEGYNATGDKCTAKYYGDHKGHNLKEAIYNFGHSLSVDSRVYIDFDNLTFWGCKIFDNESDARKAFV